jgi:hypothetical protein
MLSAYLVLLESLKTGRMDKQEDWESVRNLTIIFSKIIKQRPDAYDSLNGWLLEMMEEQPDELVLAAMELLLEPCMHDDGISQRSRRMGQAGAAAGTFS